MSEYVKLASGASDLYLAALAEFQDNILKSMTALSDATPTGSKIPVPPSLADFPTPLEVAEANFAFTEKLLKQQKSFAEKFLATTTPGTSTPRSRHK
jgi:hypothetical protein